MLESEYRQYPPDSSVNIPFYSIPGKPLIVGIRENTDINMKNTSEDMISVQVKKSLPTPQ